MTQAIVRLRRSFEAARIRNEDGREDLMEDADQFNCFPSSFSLAHDQSKCRRARESAVKLTLLCVK